MRTQSTNRAPALLGAPIMNWSGTVFGKEVSPATSAHSSVTTQTTSVAPKMARTSPGTVGAGHDLLAERVDRAARRPRCAVPGRCPPAWPIGTTREAGLLVTPSPASTSRSHRPRRSRLPNEVAVAESTAGTPHRAWVATAWQGQ